MRRHNFLYSGPFADHINLDIPYVPQLTRARTTIRTTGQDALRGAQFRHIEVDMRVTTVDLLRIARR